MPIWHGMVWVRLAENEDIVVLILVGGDMVDVALLEVGDTQAS